VQKPRTRSSSTPPSHRRWTPEDARHALAALELSGLGLRAFAVREGLDPQRLTRWRRQLVSPAPPTFQEIRPVAIAAVIDGAAPARVERERFEIVLPSGRVVRVLESFDADALRRLLSVVDEARAC
jgi:transposase